MKVFLAILGVASLSVSVCQLRADAGTTTAAKKVKIVLVGDSTVQDNSGWGLGLREFLDTNKVELINTARGGRSSMSFMREGRWTNALALKADYYLIQFGHNNQPGHPGRETDMATYVSNMTQYVTDTLAIGAKPVLITPLTRRQWDKGDPSKSNPRSNLTPPTCAGSRRRKIFRSWICTRAASNFAKHWAAKSAMNSARSKSWTARIISTARI